MNMKNIRYIASYAAVAMLSLPVIVFGEGDGTGKITNPLGNKNSDLFSFIDTLIDAVLKLGSIVAVLAIIYAGFLFVTASGDEKKISTAKSVLLYAVIGIAILLGARALSAVIVNTVETVGKAAK